MNAVGADQDVALCGADMRAGAVEEISGDAGFILLEGAKPVAGMHPRFAEPGAHGLIDDVLQLAPMNRELRHVEAGVEPAQFVPDRLAEAVGVEQFVGADGDRIEPLQQPQIFEFTDRMGQRVDADAKLANAVGLLENLAVDAAGVEHQRRGQSADAAADNDRLHDAILERNMVKFTTKIHYIAAVPGQPALVIMVEQGG